jgi:hypothetical protein
MEDERGALRASGLHQFVAEALCAKSDLSPDPAPVPFV